MRTWKVALVSVLVAGALSQSAIADEVHKQAAVVAAQLGTMAKHLQARPVMALDFSHVSGEYCLNTWKAGGSHMSHYAIDASNTKEDVIDFVKADSLTEVGVDVSSLPRFPGKLGAMEPNTWYYLPANEFEPHHGTKFPIALLIRASDLQ